ncbi:unnamed protein product, partial [Scytosiphon promiscuus]
KNPDYNHVWEGERACTSLFLFLRVNHSGRLAHIHACASDFCVINRRCVCTQVRMHERLHRDLKSKRLLPWVRLCLFREGSSFVFVCICLRCYFHDDECLRA